jgi:oligopeptide/dipeptide ABC transporter ATP-binding protein
MQEPVLAVRDLTTSFKTRSGWFPAVRGVSFEVRENETLCLVGESGCGKSITALSIMGLLPGQRTCRAEGEVVFEGRQLLGLSDSAMRVLRGAKMSMIFQEPMTSLNPVLPIGLQVSEPLIEHGGLTHAAAQAEAIRLLDLVRIPDARRRMSHYPHQFSGGMRQRVMIAMALACKPTILFADEPTTALDVTIQAQVLALLNDLRADTGMSLVLITHDLGVVASMADRVAVMYAGEVVETALVGTLFSRPTHPYTEALLRSIPRSDRDIDALMAIGGQVPAIDAMPDGCRFAPRCTLAEPRCRAVPPVLAPIAMDNGHRVRCWVRAPAAAPAAPMRKVVR